MWRPPGSQIFIEVSQYPLLSQSGHSNRRHECPLSGVKRTCRFALQMSAFDPKRTSRHRLGLANYYSSRRQFLRAEQSGIALLALSNFRRPAVTNVGRSRFHFGLRCRRASDRLAIRSCTTVGRIPVMGMFQLRLTLTTFRWSRASSPQAKWS